MRKMIGATALLAALCLPGAAHAALNQLTDLFVFGDSLADGGNSGLASQAYAGPGVVFPPPPYYNGQYSNGPVAVEYLWQSFNPGDTSFKPSLAGGTNYAIGGATTGLESFNSVNSSVPDPLKPAYFQKSNNWQLQSFSAQSPSFDPATSLFVVWLFPNDVFYQTATGNLPGTAFGGAASPGDASALIANGLNNIVNTIGFLATSGARHFLVPNMPDLGQTPELRNGPAAGPLSALTASFNQNLAATLTVLDASMSKVDIVQFDAAGLLARAIADPAAYGFTNATESCVANLLNGQCDPSSWLFWDGVHPTTQTHQMLGREFAAAVVPEPQTYLLMVLGLSAVGWVARRRVVRAAAR